MKEYTSEELQNVSSNFRNVARRLSRTDYSQCDSNLKRFMNFINEQEIISGFIEQHNTHEYNIDEVIKEREWTSPFEISPIMDEEISFEYQMLEYAVNKFDADFTRLYGTHWYTSSKSTVNDEMQKFIAHIIDPLIDYISEYLRNCYNEKLHEEENNRPKEMNGITANYSTVVVANNIDGAISNNVSISQEMQKDALDIIDSIKENISDDENLSDILDVLKLIEAEIKSNNRPKKGIFVALKSLCGGSVAVITLINALMKLFGLV